MNSNDSDCTNNNRFSIRSLPRRLIYKILVNVDNSTLYTISKLKTYDDFSLTKLCDLVLLSNSFFNFKKEHQLLNIGNKILLSRYKNDDTKDDYDEDKTSASSEELQEDDSTLREEADFENNVDKIIHEFENKLQAVLDSDESKNLTTNQNMLQHMYKKDTNQVLLEVDTGNDISKDGTDKSNRAEEKEVVILEADFDSGNQSKLSINDARGSPVMLTNLIEMNNNDEKEICSSSDKDGLLLDDDDNNCISSTPTKPANKMPVLAVESKTVDKVLTLFEDSHTASIVSKKDTGEQKISHSSILHSSISEKIKFFEEQIKLYNDPVLPANVMKNKK